MKIRFCFYILSIFFALFVANYFNEVRNEMELNNENVIRIEKYPLTQMGSWDYECITDNLTIYSQGKRPIYEVEKYDKILFGQFTNDDSYLHIDSGLDDYPDVTYSIESNYETRTVNVFIYGSKSDNESELRKIIEDYLNDRFENSIEIMHDTEINITFE